MTDNNKPVRTHTFVFNPDDNGGESLSLETQWFSNGDPDGFYTNQYLRLQSYCNEASIGLCGVSLTPELLRKLANQLESEEIQVHATTNNNNAT